MILSEFLHACYNTILVLTLSTTHYYTLRASRGRQGELGCRPYILGIKAHAWRTSDASHRPTCWHDQHITTLGSAALHKLTRWCLRWPACQPIFRSWPTGLHQWLVAGAARCLLLARWPVVCWRNHDGRQVAWMCDAKHRHRGRQQVVLALPEPVYRERDTHTAARLSTHTRTAASGSSLTHSYTVADQWPGDTANGWPPPAGDSVKATALTATFVTTASRAAGTSHSPSSSLASSPRKRWYTCRGVVLLLLGTVGTWSPSSPPYQHPSSCRLDAGQSPLLSSGAAASVAVAPPKAPAWLCT